MKQKLYRPTIPAYIILILLIIFGIAIYERYRCESFGKKIGMTTYYDLFSFDGCYVKMDDGRMLSIKDYQINKKLER